MRNKFYFCSIKICGLGFVVLDLTNSLKAFSGSLPVVEAFSLESHQDAPKSGSPLVRGQVNMVDEGKLCIPICSTSEALVVQHAVRRCHGKD